MFDIAIGAAIHHLTATFEHNRFQAVHLVWAEGDGALSAHFHARPAIIIMRGGNHGNARHIQFELGEIGHR